MHILVVYKDGSSKLVRNPADFPDLEERSFKVARLQEPMVLATLIFPDVKYLITQIQRLYNSNCHFLIILGIHGKID